VRHPRLRPLSMVAPKERTDSTVRINQRRTRQLRRSPAPLLYLLLAGSAPIAGRLNYARTLRSSTFDPAFHRCCHLFGTKPLFLFVTVNPRWFNSINKSDRERSNSPSGVSTRRRQSICSSLIVCCRRSCRAVAPGSMINHEDSILLGHQYPSFSGHNCRVRENVEMKF
jgi:hypothetical protein